MEMTIEQKAKAYEEALEKAKSKIKNDKDYVLYEDDVIEIFPELAESEDEKIRKELLAVIDDLILPDEQKKRFIAWLAKKSEQKPIKHNNDATIDSNLNDYCCKVYNALHKENGGNLSFERLQHLAMDIYKWCREQHTHAEWSDEDEKHLKLAIDNFQTLGNSFLTAWLKSLKDRVQPQHKQEWSEEDEKVLNLIIARLHSHPNVEAEEYGKDYHWLKSLKDRVQPHSQWKPSKEQMKALNTCIMQGEISYVGQGPELQSLYNDLKELTE